MKKIVIIMLLLIIPTYSLAIKGEGTIIDGVMGHLESKRSDARECLRIQLEADPKDSKIIEINVREIHNLNCGGDPNTAPRYGFYKVNKMTGLLSEMDIATAEYKPIKIIGLADNPTDTVKSNGLHDQEGFTLFIATLIARLLDPISFIIVLFISLFSRKKWFIPVIALAGAIVTETLLTSTQVTRSWGQGIVLGIIASGIHAVFCHYLIQRFNKRKLEISDNRDSLEIDHDLESIDPPYVESCAKVYRIVGLTIVIAFVIWGVNYQWSYSDSPFESLISAFGASYRHEGLYSLLMASLIFMTGYYFRFGIGAFFVSTILKIWNISKSIFNKI
ncbi:hypothetical protein EZI54_22375 [Marinobacter halodurans]|uniref:Uncharacterized protein n=1 Tax=Marinobacter halodurans TaxID=2528979 RepID=A0ABY1ZE64_9GAMM|nr:hypothetical protein [Marinobacter halodurans]TBW47618.1 hypothetical protein EZI54_22375 [Marinobacter halodurans]